MNNKSSNIDEILQQMGSLQESLRMPAYDIASQMSTIVESLRMPTYDMAKQMSTIVKSLRMPTYDIAKQMGSLQESLRMPVYNIAKQMSSLQKSLRMPAYDIASQMSTIVESLRMPTYHLAEQLIALQDSFNKGALGNVRQLLNNINYEELEDAISGFDELIRISSDESSDENINQETYNSEELLELIDSRIAERQANASSDTYTLKRFLYDLALNVSTEIAKYFLNIVISTFLLVGGYVTVENHFSLVNQLQINIYEHEVNNYREVKKIIKTDNNLANYEYLNEMGILRKDTFIRNGNNRNSHLAYLYTIPQNTVVSIIENRNNWILVQFKIEDELVEGWVEESKVIKFQKKNNETNATRFLIEECSFLFSSAL